MLTTDKISCAVSSEMKGKGRIERYAAKYSTLANPVYVKTRWARVMVSKEVNE